MNKHIYFIGFRPDAQSQLANRHGPSFQHLNSPVRRHQNQILQK